jgi:uncharacterized protein
MRPPLEGGSILITGASSGIGRELARQLAPRARALVLVARRSDRLLELQGELQAGYPSLQVSVRPCDLGDLVAADRLIDTILDDLGSIDVLINNAGLGDLGLFESAPWEKLEQMCRVNMVSLTRITHRLLGPMLSRGRGGILNVSSGVGLTFLPGMAVYTGTKHYLSSFTEALRLELRGTGVVVSQLCPGPVATEFLEVAGNPTGRAVPKVIEISAARCAHIAISGFARGRALIVPGLMMRVILGLGRVTPRPVLRLVYRWIGAYLRRRARLLESGEKSPSG